MQPDPRLGFAVTFPQDLFENGIRFAMQMGAPNDPAKRATFVFPGTGRTYWRNGVQIPEPRTDWDGKPLDPTVEVRKGEPRRVTVDCAIEVSANGSPGQTPIGNFPGVQLRITLMESDWRQVVGCEAVEYNGDRYIYDHEPENVALFTSNFHTMIFISEDES